MSLRFAILGLLARESLTGYDLTKRFDTTIGFFWSAKHSQIYPELASLTEEGLVTFELITQTSKPNKKVYTITDDGREALRHWVASPRDKRSVKDPLLMRAWVVGMVDPGVAIAQLRDALQEFNQRTAALEEHEATVQANGADAATPDNAWLGAAMALRCGLMQARAYRDWLVWAIAELEPLQASEKRGAGTAS
jgi:DNA-binding PadR family transcriptional regulator